MNVFDLDGFIGACLTASEDHDPVGAIADVVERAVSDPDAIEHSIGHLVDDSLGLLHRSDHLTIQHGIFPPGYVTGIHEHTVSAIIGTWAGYEDNDLFLERSGTLELSSHRRCRAGDVLTLAPSAIHNVHAPTSRWVAGFHVYLGDLRALARREWDAEDANPKPLDGERMVASWLPAIAQAGLRRERA